MFNVEDRVKSNIIGSWTYNKVGVIEKLNIESSDNIYGHLIRYEGIGVSVIEPTYLTKE